MRRSLSGVALLCALVLLSVTCVARAEDTRVEDTRWLTGALPASPIDPTACGFKGPDMQFECPIPDGKGGLTSWSVSGLDSSAATTTRKASDGTVTKTVMYAPVEIAAGHVSIVNSDVSADAYSCVVLLYGAVADAQGGARVVDQLELSTSAGPCGGNPSERCYYGKTNVRSERFGFDFWSATFHKTWCGVTGKYFTRQDKSADADTGDCVEGPTQPATYTKAFSKTHGRSWMRGVFKFHCGGFFKQQDLNAGGDYYSGGHWDPWNNTE